MNFPNSTLTPGDHECTLQHDSARRSYKVHVPENYHPRQAAPLILAFHGGGSNAAGMQRFSGLSEKADEAGFIVVYPNGTGHGPQQLWWNTGIEYQDSPKDHADDVGYVSALLDELPAQLNIDTRSIYLTGMSNGGMLCYQLAAELAERIAAMASVGGTMVSGELAIERPLPIMHLHGTEDHFVPFEGGQGKRSVSRAAYPAVRETIVRWVRANHCQENPVITDYPILVDDGTRIFRETYTGVENRSEVVLIVIDGGGHTWPGRKPTFLYLGKSTRNLIANDVIWDFFRRHHQRT